jgi:hypothetical protein
MSITNPSLIDIRDEGVSQGRVTALDFTGAGVAASVAGFVGTVNVPGSSGGSSSNIVSSNTTVAVDTFLYFVDWMEVSNGITLTIEGQIEVG